MVRFLVLALLVTCWGCAGSAHPQSDDAGTASTGATEAGAAPADGEHTGAEPHGDHRPRYGGVVIMNGDLHFEIVSRPSGEYRVYFSDELRRELPASIVSDVLLTVTYPDKAPAEMKLDVDEAGESWVCQGTPITGADSTLRVSYRSGGEPYWIDIQWMPPAPGALAL